MNIFNLQPSLRNTSTCTDLTSSLMGWGAPETQHSMPGCLIPDRFPAVMCIYIGSLKFKDPIIPDIFHDQCVKNCDLSVILWPWFLGMFIYSAGTNSGIV